MRRMGRKAEIVMQRETHIGGTLAAHVLSHIEQAVRAAAVGLEGAPALFKHLMKGIKNGCKRLRKTLSVMYRCFVHFSHVDVRQAIPALSAGRKKREDAHCG
jgi:hypothetical protein